jgi:hypothetical protein
VEEDVLLLKADVEGWEPQVGALDGSGRRQWPAVAGRLPLAAAGGGAVEFGLGHVPLPVLLASVLPCSRLASDTWLAAPSLAPSPHHTHAHCLPSPPATQVVQSAEKLLQRRAVTHLLLEYSPGIWERNRRMQGLCELPHMLLNLTGAGYR